jgi:hypothetical protein
LGCSRSTRCRWPATVSGTRHPGPRAMLEMHRCWRESSGSTMLATVRSRPGSPSAGLVHLCRSAARSSAQASRRGLVRLRLPAGGAVLARNSCSYRSAGWSFAAGAPCGSFIYVPTGVHVEIPLHARAMASDRSRLENESRNASARRAPGNHSFPRPRAGPGGVRRRYPQRRGELGAGLPARSRPGARRSGPAAPAATAPAATGCLPLPAPG